MTEIFSPSASLDAPVSVAAGGWRAVPLAGGAQAAPRLQRLDAGEVAVELGGEEADAAHLTLDHDVDASVLLVPQCRIDRVVLELGQVGGPQLATLRGCYGQVEPARMGV